MDLGVFKPRSESPRPWDTGWHHMPLEGHGYGGRNGVGTDRTVEDSHPQGHAVVQTSMESVLASVSGGSAQLRSLRPTSLSEAFPPTAGSPCCCVYHPPRVSSLVIVTEPSIRKGKMDIPSLSVDEPEPWDQGNSWSPKTCFTSLEHRKFRNPAPAVGVIHTAAGRLSKATLAARV